MRRTFLFTVGFARLCRVSGCGGQRATGEIGGELEHDLAQLLVARRGGQYRVEVGLWRVLHEEHAGRADGEDGGSGADPGPRWCVGTGDDLHKRAQPRPELGEAVFAVLRPVDGRLVALEEPEDLAALQHDGYVAVDQFPGGPGTRRLLPAPGDERVKPGEVVLGEAADDVFLRLEVVVKRGLRDAETLGDLPQGCPLVPLLSEKLERDLLDPRPGVTAPPRVRVFVHGCAVPPLP